MEDQETGPQREDIVSFIRRHSRERLNNSAESQAGDQTSGGQQSSTYREVLLRQCQFDKSRVTLNLKLKELEEEIARLNLQSDAGTTSLIEQSDAGTTSLIELDSEGGTAAEYFLVRDRTHRFFQPVHGILPAVTKIEKFRSMKLQVKFLETQGNLVSHQSPTQLLFHRTSDDRIERILQRGFRLPPSQRILRRSFPLPPSDQTNKFGQGIYFATESSSSAEQIYTRGSNKLLLCEVLLGKTWTVQKPQPEMNKRRINKQGYDSLFSKGGGTVYDEFVVYDCYQAIPRYVVHYNNVIFDPAAMQPSQTLADQNLTRIQYKMSPTFCGDSLAEYHFRLAESQFLRMSSSNLYKVVMVELIINKTLLRRYERAKEEFGQKKPSVEERLVFHGTVKDAVEKIIEEGFKIGGQGVEVKNGCSFGSGVYTALDPNISVFYSGPDSMMLLSVALLGQAGEDYSIIGESAKVLVFKKAEYLLPKYVVHFAKK